MKDQVDYDQIAPKYDQRFDVEGPTITGLGLLQLIERLRPRSILEVGCGTGHWLELLEPLVETVYGLDPSLAMLGQAHKGPRPSKLTLGVAEHLPFKDQSLEFVFCFNALHHFDAPRTFIREAFRTLRPDGHIAVFGSDPRDAGGRESWYVYQYFDSTWETDLARFPSWNTVSDWMVEAGFRDVECWETERLVDPKQGRDVLNDPFLRKHSCSQLALLTDEEYAVGLRRIRTALRKAEAERTDIVFQTIVSHSVVLGEKNG